MPKYLVIVESPNKVKKIKSYLGEDYEVTFTAGHIMDLPPEGINVDIKNNFKPTYEIIDGKHDVVKTIQTKAAKADVVYLATDLDREGEYISSAIISILPKGTKYKRIRFGSITKSEIQDSIKNATDLDQKLVDSAETRRILDRICGYKVSFPTQQATGGKSAGRVQSAALRILAEREKEIISFVPKEYWNIDVELETDKGERFTASIKKPDKMDITNQKEAETICDILKKKTISVSKYEVKDVSTKPFPPFTTSSLYMSASSILNWNSKKTAGVAQSIYENGRCSYIRTDSTFIVPEFINSMRELIPCKYGSDYLSHQINIYTNKKSAQEAHEAIRATVLQDEEFTGSDDNRLYELVWKRSIASQMASMVQSKSSAELVCQDYILSANGSKVIFDGWRKCWDYGKLEDSELPKLKIGQKLKVISVTPEQKFTVPPSRYSEASFIGQLEKLGIGRPSTYKTIITTLRDREYVKDDKSKTLVVTDMGIRVSDFLTSSDFCFIDTSFTASLEEKLDGIAHANISKLEVLSEFWKRLKKDLENAAEIKKASTKTEYKCKKCDGFLEIKHSKFGKFFSCENRTDKEIKCDYKCQVGEHGEPVEKIQKEMKESSIECSNCGEYLLVKTSKKGNEYLSCRNWKDKNCSGFYKITGEKMEFKKKTFKKWGKKKEK